MGITYKDGKAIRWTGMPATIQEQCRRLEVHRPTLSPLVATYAVEEDGIVAQSAERWSGREEIEGSTPSWGQCARAGFTLTGAPLQKKCGGPSPRKNWRPFFSHHRPPLVRCQFSWKTDDFFSLITLGGCPLFGISCMQKIRRSFCGAPFCGGLCSAEHA